MVDRIVGMYFSPTGTTEQIVQELVEILAMQLKCEKDYVDFTLPEVREDVQTFKEGDLVVFGVPVYAGRVPNLMLKYIHTVQGCGAMAIPIVLFGNRNYDDALAELQALLAEDGFIPVAAGAFVGEHSFSEILGAGRPDNADMEVVEAFAEDIYNKLTLGHKKSLPSRKAFRILLWKTYLRNATSAEVPCTQNLPPPKALGSFSCILPSSHTIFHSPSGRTTSTPPLSKFTSTPVT